MPSLRTTVWVAWGLLILGGTFVLGCDGSGSKRASFFERLADTTWAIERLEGPGIAPNLLDQRYTRVRVDFDDQNDGGTYRITGRFSSDSTEVLAAGRIVLPGDDLLQMASGFGRRGPVTWTFEFEASRAIFAVRAGSQTFLRTLFPNTTWSPQAVTMTLAPSDQ